MRSPLQKPAMTDIEEEMLTCERCRLPLEIHETLVDLSPGAYDQLTSSNESAFSSPQTSTKRQQQKHLYPDRRDALYQRVLKSHHSSSRANIPTSSNRRSPNQSLGDQSIFGGPAESYVVLTESQIAPAKHVSEPSAKSNENNSSNTLSQKLKTASKLFDVLSSKSEISHPVCAECTEILLDGMNKRLSDSTKERDAYIEFLKRANADIPTDAEREAAQKEYYRIIKEEEQALKHLESLEKQSQDLENEFASLQAELSKLEIEEEEFWKSKNEFMSQLEDFQNERDSVNLGYDHDSKQLERLQRTNVYNDVFCISHDGHFGTINGLRLGRSQQYMVEWTEINAAWGQTLLLLVTVAEKLQFEFEGYLLHPRGCTSAIEKIERDANNRPRTQGNEMLELYSSGDSILPNLVAHRKIDAAMVAFLECLHQLGQFTRSQDANLKLPYGIHKDRIGDHCIKLAFNQFEEWTKALKCVLTNCKWILAFASSHRRRPGQPGHVT
ncbi:Vacuolar protein sorting-associated protein atg6 [Neolecta irregularis DAH-3]|uniref:Vacuolar protein sorting-associated protein atg6 n=1 Tax=Neolecta irregularis (strain DAH-3) TaxID=1198029 RepID=A0A1U7LJA4_NEOID|nr:Vacuolar protein sorting-associated protein atg6 [Neolecta irregularis DAH-3]|eukprot:OLL22735.1 Vacuolar protein sorting-associated protein atg6 [Neolecta irregularis DAH-3]